MHCLIERDDAAGICSGTVYINGSTAWWPKCWSWRLPRTEGEILRGSLRERRWVGRGQPLSTFVEKSMLFQQFCPENSCSCSAEHIQRSCSARMASWLQCGAYLALSARSRIVTKGDSPLASGICFFNKSRSGTIKTEARRPVLKTFVQNHSVRIRSDKAFSRDAKRFCACASALRVLFVMLARHHGENTIPLRCVL